MPTDLIFQSNQAKAAAAAQAEADYLALIVRMDGETTVAGDVDLIRKIQQTLDIADQQVRDDVTAFSMARSQLGAIAQAEAQIGELPIAQEIAEEIAAVNKRIVATIRPLLGEKQQLELSLDRRREADGVVSELQRQLHQVRQRTPRAVAAAELARK